MHKKWFQMHSQPSYSRKEILLPLSPFGKHDDEDGMMMMARIAINSTLNFPTLSLSFFNSLSIFFLFIPSLTLLPLQVNQESFALLTPSLRPFLGPRLPSALKGTFFLCEWVDECVPPLSLSHPFYFLSIFPLFNISCSSYFMLQLTSFPFIPLTFKIMNQLPESRSGRVRNKIISRKKRDGRDRKVEINFM